MEEMKIIGCEDKTIDFGKAYYVSSDNKRHHIMIPKVAEWYG